MKARQALAISAYGTSRKYNAPAKEGCLRLQSGLSQAIHWRVYEQGAREGAADSIPLDREHERNATDVALNLAIEMKLARRCHIAGDRELFADSRDTEWTRFLRTS
jgi:hypothetical protein